MENSEKIKFAFGGKTEIKEDSTEFKDEDQNVSPVEEMVKSNIPDSEDDDLNKEYIDRRSVSIALVSIISGLAR